MIRDYVIEDISKYSFITDCYKKGLYIYAWFVNKDGEEDFKKIKVFANKPQLQKFIRQIKNLSKGKEIGKNTKTEYIIIVA